MKKITSAAILVLCFIFISKVYHLFPHWDIHLLSGKWMDLRWFVDMMCQEVKYLILILLGWILSKRCSIVLWGVSILALFVVQNMFWLYYDGQDDNGSFYWTIYVTIVLIDSLFFWKMWRNIFIKSP